jgi:hypothetical protein
MVIGYELQGISDALYEVMLADKSHDVAAVLLVYGFALLSIHVVRCYRQDPSGIDEA